MQFIKDLAKILGIIVGLVLLLTLIGWVLGAKKETDKTEYYLYEHEVADDFNEQQLFYEDSINKIIQE